MVRSSHGTDDLDVDDPDEPDDAPQPPQLGALPYVVDLDREANPSGGSDVVAGTEPAATDYDVS